MSEPTESHQEAVALLRICWRRRWFVGAVTACAVAATYLVLSFKQPVYEATAYLLASGAPSSRLVKQPDTLLLSDLLQVTESPSTRTLTALLQSAFLLQEAKASLPAELAQSFPDAWSMPVRVENIPGTEVVAVHVRSANKDAAIALADVIGRKGVELSARINEEATQEGGRSLEAELTRSRDKADAAHQRLQEIRDKHSIADLPSEMEGTVLQLLDLQQQRAGKQVALDGTRSEVAEARSQSQEEPAFVPTAATEFRSPLLEQALAPGSGSSASSVEPGTSAEGADVQATDSASNSDEGAEGNSRTAVLGSASRGPNPLRMDSLVRTSQLRRDEARLVSEIAALNRAIESVEQRLQDLAAIEAAWNRASDAYRVLQESYATMLASQEEIEVRRKARLEDVQVMAKARLKPYPVAPRRALSLGAALALGLLVGAIGAILSDLYGGASAPGRGGRPPAGEQDVGA